MKDYYKLQGDCKPWDEIFRPKPVWSEENSLSLTKFVMLYWLFKSACGAIEIAPKNSHVQYAQLDSSKQNLESKGV